MARKLEDINSTEESQMLERQCEGAPWPRSLTGR